ncbi:MAG: adenosylcobalamin-dependent ribonucleoside-diphosphate reductase [Acidobacteriota bacterium]
MRGRGGAEVSVEDTWRRVAKALASVEVEPQHWESRFYAVLEGFRFLPGGRIEAGAGSGKQVTLFNCFVMGAIEDSLDGIFRALKEGALTMQQGGGIGYDFSTLRPAGAAAKRTGAIASGPISFMRVWDAMCATVMSTGARRGAMMATLRCDHPDIEAFIDAKRERAALRHFNLSVLVTDAFMRAVEDDADWALVFPGGDTRQDPCEIVQRVWPGAPQQQSCRVYGRVEARALWDRIMRATYDCAEPGVVFIDRIQAQDNLGYGETIIATNPCGEVPLPAYGACNLGSLNLPQFVMDPFTAHAALDFAALVDAAAIATRMLDNVYDLSAFPLQQQADQAQLSRRIGLGVTGLADALIMVGLEYGSPAARTWAAQMMSTLTRTAYRASTMLAAERGTFPLFERERFVGSPFVKSLPAELRAEIAAKGMRNSHLTAIAPAGTISLLANSVSSGIEPVFEFHSRRRVRQVDGTIREIAVTDYAYRTFRETFGNDATLPPAFIAAEAVDPFDQLAMQAALQPHVDNAISKTLTIPVDYSFERFRLLYAQAYASGLKGCTTFRPNPVTGTVLVPDEPAPGGKQCCTVEREPA